MHVHSTHTYKLTTSLQPSIPLQHNHIPYLLQTSQASTTSLQHFYNLVTSLLEPSNKLVTTLLQAYKKVVTRLSQGCHSYKIVTRLSQGCYCDKEYIAHMWNIQTKIRYQFFNSVLCGKQSWFVFVS